MQIVISLVFAFALCLLILKWDLFKKSNLNSKTFCFIFIIKLLFGIGFYLVYTVHYSDNQTSDMHKYFNDAVKIFNLTKEKPLSYLSILTGVELNEKSAEITQQLNFWYQEESASVINDSRMVIRFNLLLLPLSRGNIYLHLVVIVFLSFFGLYLLYLSFEKYYFNKELLLLLACFGIPSVMFWSSGIMKEGVLIFFLGSFIYCLFHESIKKPNNIVCLILALFGIFFSKFYVALSLLPAILFLIVCFVLKRKSNYLNLFITLIFVLCTAFVFNTLLSNLPLQKLSKKQNDFINLSIGGVYLVNKKIPFDTIFTLHKNSILAYTDSVVGNSVQLKEGTTYHHWKNPGYADTLIAKKNNEVYAILKMLDSTGSAISLKRLMPSYKSVISLFPEAFINVFFRPFVNDVGNVFSLLACIENMAFILLILILFFNYKKPEKQTQKIIIFSCLFVFTLYTLVGLTTPVLGAAVRYKVPAFPFLILSLFLLYDVSKTKWKLNGNKI